MPTDRPKRGRVCVYCRLGWHICRDKVKNERCACNWCKDRIVRVPND